MRPWIREELIPLVVVASLAATSASGQQHAHAHEHDAGAHDAVHFTVSCDPSIREDFNRAVAVLHSFGYEEARNLFQSLSARDPACGMAHWGVAMTYYHPLWAPPTPRELAAGREAAGRATAAGAETDRERAYIAAIGAFYDPDRRDHPTRARAYHAAMEELVSRFPQDDEARIFHALAMLGAAPPSDGEYAVQKAAVAVLNEQLTRHPRHPGIAHYLIHALDYPALAEQGLPAATTYASLAPESPHALHMPSHIFTRLGRWRDVIESNLACARVARAQVARTHPGAASFEDLHCKDYLAYAYLQTGEDDRAQEVLEEVLRARRFDDPNIAVGYAILAIPARFALERRDWRTAARLAPPSSVEFPWESHPEVRSLTHFANAIGAARGGDLERARRAVAALDELQERMRASPPAGPYDWAGHTDALRLTAAAWLAHAEGRSDEAVRLMTQAAEMDERVGKHPVTPGPLLPPRELLGDLLLELRMPREALAAYEASLEASPRRFNGVLGAARAARQAGMADRAAALYAELLELAPESSRRELAAEARAHAGSSTARTPR